MCNVDVERGRYAVKRVFLARIFFRQFTLNQETSMLFAVVLALSAASSDPVIKTSKTDTNAILATCRNSMDALVNGDPALLSSTLHPGFVNRSPASKANSPAYSLDVETREQLIEGTRKGAYRKPGNSWKTTCTVLSANEYVAATKVETPEYVAYDHQGKFDGKWLIFNSTWYNKTAGPAELAQADRKAILRTCQDNIDGQLEGNPDRVQRTLHPSALMRTVDTGKGHKPLAFEAESVEKLLSSTRQGVLKVPRNAWNRRCSILDAGGSAASTRMETPDFVAYDHLGKFGGKWLILNSTWYYKPESP